MRALHKVGLSSFLEMEDNIINNRKQLCRTPFVLVKILSVALAVYLGSVIAAKHECAV